MAVPAQGDQLPSVDDVDAEDDDVDEPVEAPRPRSTPFGSVWDSQLGTAAPAARLGPLAEDEEDFDEPEIPEYLIAEQRQGNRGGGAPGRGPARGGPRGGRSAYQSAVARERYGRGGTGGINRYPDVSGRTASPQAPRRDDRSYSRSDDRPRDTAPRSSSTEPWSEVPPELEAMLRAQVTQRPTTRGTETAPATSNALEDVIGTSSAEIEDAASTAAPKRRATRSSTTKTTAARATKAAPKARTTRKPATAAASGADADAAVETASAASKRRTTRKSASTGAADDAGTESTTAAASKRRTTRKAATATTDSD